MVETVVIDGIEYVKQKNNFIFSNYFMVRTYSAGVFYGNIHKRNGKEVVMHNARRVWRWEGAASLSELAMHGTSKPNDCKFPCAVHSVILTEAIEIIPMTDEAVKSLNSVPIWTAHE